MPLVLLGLIAVGAALLLIFYSRRPGGSSGMGPAKRVQAQVVPEKHYKKSEDGKVVYLFGDDDEDDVQGGDDAGDSGAGDPGDPASGDDGDKE